MTVLLWVHVAGGAAGLAAGFAALYARKGARAHRTAGRLFVYAMLAMGLSGAFIAAVTGVETSVLMGVFAAYLVLTGLTAVVPPGTWHRTVGLAGAAVALALSAALTEVGVRGAGSPGGAVEGLPAPMAFLFGAIALAAGVSDARVARAGPLRGGRRLARHLWRMCFALFIASASFFLGQTQVLPPPLREPWVLAPPVLAPLLVMAYWLRRTRARRPVALVDFRGGRST